MSRKKNKRKYFELSCAFDIETSSFYENGQKRACMYVWQFGINGTVFVGRTWYQFMKFYHDLIEELCVTPECCLIVYVHNLAYEFQWIRNWFEWENVFAIKSRTPVYARTAEGVEFRCSYILSGYSLAKLSDQIQTYQIEKLVGNLDYSLIRNSKTVLTEKEMQYCINDVLVVMAYIDEQITRNGSVSKIPLTKTGYVRRYCRHECMYQSRKEKTFKALRYRSLMKNLTIEPDEYTELKEAFSGGFTHASAFYSGVTVNDVTSFDFTSSYPFVMVSEQFPMGKGKKVYPKTETEFREYLKYYACMFRVDFYGIHDTFIYEHYISASKCRGLQNAVKDNGRIVSADHLQITVTEKDFTIIENMYAWDRMTISAMWIYRRGYLPTDFVKAVLKLYGDKTKLKGIEGMEAEYLSSKEMVNSCYGMMVTDPLQEENKYSNGMWLPASLPDVGKTLKTYNSNFGRFIFYPWGVWVTAAARFNLATGIYELGEDYVYSDTDSIKGVNMEKHMEYIENYNRHARKKLELACRFHEIDISLTEPETVNGEKKPLGVWDYDGSYSRFKTLGAKRYMVESAKSGEVNITVSGLNKRATVPFLCEGWNTSIDGKTSDQDPFDRFTDRLYVPAEYTGKMIHTYIDVPMRGSVVDYQGNKAGYYEKSCIHMEPAEYLLSIAEEYAAYLTGLEDLD